MPHPVLSFSNTTFVQLPPGTRRASLRISASYPVQANAGVALYRKRPGATSWTTLPTGMIDNSTNTAVPDVFDAQVDAGFEYAFTFKGTAMAVAPGSNEVKVGFGLFANDVQLVDELGGPKVAEAAAAGLVGSAFFRV